MSDVRLKGHEAKSYYGRRGGGGGGDNDDDDDESSSEEEHSMAPSGHRAVSRHYRGGDEDDGGRSLTLTRSRLDVAQLKLQGSTDEADGLVANPWDPDHNEVHHVTIRYTVQLPRSELSEPRQKPLSVKVEFPVDAMLPHTKHRIDEHLKRAHKATAEDYSLDDIIIVGVERVSASTNTLQRLGVRSNEVLWMNTARDHDSREAFLFTLSGDPNGGGQGERRSDLYTIVDNTQMLKSRLYTKYGDVKPEQVKRDVHVSEKAGVFRYNVRGDSTLYKIIVDRRHRLPGDYDIEAAKRDKDGWIRDVPSQIVRPIVALVRDVRSHVRSIDASKGLALEIHPIGAKALESLEGTVYEKSLPGESAAETAARAQAYLNQVTQITFELCFHYMTRFPAVEKQKARKAAPGETRRVLTEEEKEALFSSVD